jgi:hypothetical protein
MKSEHQTEARIEPVSAADFTASRLQVVPLHFQIPLVLLGGALFQDKPLASGTETLGKCEPREIGDYEEEVCRCVTVTMGSGFDEDEVELKDDSGKRKTWTRKNNGSEWCGKVKGKLFLHYTQEAN